MKISPGLSEKEAASLYGIPPLRTESADSSSVGSSWPAASTSPMMLIKARAPTPRNPCQNLRALKSDQPRSKAYTPLPKSTI